MNALPTYVRCLLLTLVVATGLTRARADFFNYSYLFADGLSVTGSFEGTQNGNWVENISNISLFVDGAQAAGTIYTATFDESLYSWVTGSVISFDALQSNFLFVNDDYVGGGFGYDTMFYLISGTSFFDGAFAQGSQGVTGSEAVMAASWSLTKVSTSVPDAAATATLFAIGMVSLILFRRGDRRSAYAK